MLVYSMPGFIINPKTPCYTSFEIMGMGRNKISPMLMQYFMRQEGYGKKAWPSSHSIYGNYWEQCKVYMTKNMA
jgi:hypothetical protein